MAQPIYTNVTETHTSPGLTPGLRIQTTDTQGLKEYAYVLFNNGTGNLTPAAGAVCYWVVGASAGLSTVTTDVSDSDINHVAGVMVSVPADGEYCYIQTKGYYATVATDGGDDIASGDAVIGGGDGVCNSVAQDTAPTNKIIGFAVAADVDAANTVAVRLEL